MPSMSTIGVFCLAAIALIVVPGPAVLYVVGRSLHQGRAAGLVSCLGISTGGLVHVGAAALGVSALLASSAVAFSTVKFAGAAYLVFLGIRKLRERGPIESGVLSGGHRLRRVYAQGIVVNVLNPKSALFVLAFLPQFVDPAKGQGGLQALVLGMIFVGLALLSDSTYALLTSAAGTWLGRRRGITQRGNVLAGSVYIALGATAALSGSARHA